MMMLNKTIEQFSWSCCTPLNPDLEVWVIFRGFWSLMQWLDLSYYWMLVESAEQLIENKWKRKTTFVAFKKEVWQLLSFMVLKICLAA